MKIGELARQSGLRPSRIRFYEAKGLLTAVARKSNGYREYPADSLLILNIIVGAQRTGFSLDEIRQILPADLSTWRQADLIEALRRKVADIAEMQRRLSQSRRQLHTLIQKIEDKPDDMGCADNTKRLMKEFAPVGSPSAPRTSTKRGAPSQAAARR